MHCKLWPHKWRHITICKAKCSVLQAHISSPSHFHRSLIEKATDSHTRIRKPGPIVFRTRKQCIANFGALSGHITICKAKFSVVQVHISHSADPHMPDLQGETLQCQSICVATSNDLRASSSTRKVDTIMIDPSAACDAKS